MGQATVIPHLQLAHNDNDWKAQLREAITSPAELFAILQLEDQATDLLAACEDFPLLVPRAFVELMEPGNPYDPLLLQVLPSAKELLDQPGFTADPVGETGSANMHRGIIQKYRGRVLLILAGGCAINCRYCFRRHFPYGENQNSSTEWLQALDTIASDSSISEVILSGGDPLLVSDRQLHRLVSQIAAIPHVRRLRVHTRLPVVIPERVTPGLLDALVRPGLDTVMVIHSNHANELGSGVEQAMDQARKAGMTLLNQSVLLAGVNDTSQALAELSERLFAIGVLPYYLHLLDKVNGAAHFDVSAERGTQLLEDLTAQLPGYLVPRLVREIAGAPAKTPVFPCRD